MRVTGIERVRGGYGVIVDIDRCIGCRACQLACKAWNGLPAEEVQFAGALTSPGWLTANSWKVVLFQESGGLVPVPFQCMHCLDPPCALACPVSAIVISDEGAVVINRDDCLGIGNCLRACPFEVPSMGPDGRFYKCTFCVDRIQNGLEPACVEVCPTRVFTFAPIDDVVEIARKAIAEGRAVYGVGLDSYVGGGTRWVYISSSRNAKALERFFPRVARKSLDPHTAFFVALKRRLRAVALISMLNRFFRKRLAKRSMGPEPSGQRSRL